MSEDEEEAVEEPEFETQATYDEALLGSEGDSEGEDEDE